MKKTPLLLFFILFSLSTYSQTINITDNFACFLNEVATFSHSDGSSPARNVYTGTTNGDPYQVIWNNAQNRWEIQVEWSVGSYDVTYSNTFASSPNPPNDATGTWDDVYGCGPLTDFSGTGTTSSLLPIELVSFKGTFDKEEVLLEWTTASELNNEKFQIEYSLDGIQFKTIGEVLGKGTSNELNRYSFIHHTNSINSSTIYYRLKQIDFDNQFDYSDIITININSRKDNINIYPNPTSSGIVNLSLNTSMEGKVTIRIIDPIGKIVHHEIKEISIGSNIIDCDFSGLGKGLFYIHFNQNNKTSYSKLVIE